MTRLSPEDRRMLEIAASFTIAAGIIVSAALVIGNATDNKIDSFRKDTNHSKAIHSECLPSPAK